MVSEIDIRDWDFVPFKETKKASNDWQLADWKKVEIFQEFFNSVELLRDKQIKAAQKQIPALFRPLVDTVNRGE